MFDPVPDAILPVGHWSKRKLRDETYRLEKILEILVARESNDAHKENNDLNADTRRVIREMNLQNVHLDMIQSNLSAVSSQVQKGIDSSQRAVWQIGNGTEASQRTEAVFVTGAWRRITNESAQLDRNDFAEGSSIRSLLDGVAQTSNIAFEGAASYLSAVQRDQTSVRHGVENLGVSLRGQASDIEGRMRALRAQLDDLKARLNMDDRSAVHEGYMLSGATGKEEKVLSADSAVAANGAATAAAMHTTLESLDSNLSSILSASGTLRARGSDSAGRLTDALSQEMDRIRGLQTDASTLLARADTAAAELDAAAANSTVLTLEEKTLRRDATFTTRAARARIPADAVLAARLTRARLDATQRLGRLESAAAGLLAALLRMKTAYAARLRGLDGAANGIARAEAVETALRTQLARNRTAVAAIVAAIQAETNGLDEATAPAVTRFDDSVRAAFPALDRQVHEARARVDVRARDLTTAENAGAARLRNSLKAVWEGVERSGSVLRGSANVARAVAAVAAESEKRRSGGAAEVNAAISGAAALATTMAAGAADTQQHRSAVSAALRVAAAAAANITAVVHRAADAAAAAASAAAAVRNTVVDAEAREVGEAQGIAGLRSAAAAAAAAENASLAKLQASMALHPPLLALVLIPVSTPYCPLTRADAISYSVCPPSVCVRYAARPRRSHSAGWEGDGTRAMQDKFPSSLPTAPSWPS